MKGFKELCCVLHADSCTIFSLLKKNGHIKSPASLSVSLTNHEIWYGGNVIQGDFSAIIINPIASVILKL
jgi:hypothetical protein